MYEEIEIDLGHLTLGAKLWHKEKSPTILALHGWQDNAASFDFLAPLLSEYQWIALDLPGHGLSEHLPEGSFYHFVDSIDILYRVTRTLKLDQFILMGHSMGSGMATLLTAAFPELISALILIEGPGPLSRKAEKAPESLRKSILEMQSMEKEKNTISKNFDRLVQTKMTIEKLNPEAARLISERGVNQTEHGYSWSRDKRLKVTSPLSMTEEQILSFLRKIQTRVLCIRAKSGYSLPKNVLEKRIEAISNVKLVVLEGGHHIHMENPDQVSLEIEEFLELAL